MALWPTNFRTCPFILDQLLDELIQQTILSDLRLVALPFTHTIRLPACSTCLKNPPTGLQTISHTCLANPDIFSDVIMSFKQTMLVDFVDYYIFPSTSRLDANQSFRPSILGHRSLRCATLCDAQNGPKTGVDIGTSGHRDVGRSMDFLTFPFVG
ncbi:hypothetical protein CVT25_003510 [Psilocybe cyanescens]|uniref:Uncharacterized protein n=1 Tax=Psilocybe cyanescens TaxID=93625 RepID=A0A409WP32_PSICY|nr:hypothetical protein CVT25_003510 [Psilocybe cyanescens]